MLFIIHTPYRYSTAEVALSLSDHPRPYASRWVAAESLCFPNFFCSRHSTFHFLFSPPSSHSPCSPRWLGGRLGATDIGSLFGFRLTNAVRTCRHDGYAWSKFRLAFGGVVPRLWAEYFHVRSNMPNRKVKKRTLSFNYLGDSWEPLGVLGSQYRVPGWTHI